MKNGIVQFTGFVPKSEKSHVRGWALKWAQLLNADILEKGESFDDYDALYIDQGANYSPGTLNLFGGINDDVVAHLEKLVRFKGKITMLDYSMDECGYPDLIAKRFKSGASSNSPFFTEDLVMDVSALQTETMTMFGIAEHTDKVVFGDSHTIAFAPPGAAIIRRDGSTLYGEIQKTRCIDYANSMDLTGKKLTLCFGSIDLRHHAADMTTYKLLDLANLYVYHAAMLSQNHGCDVEICAPVPVEFEDRRIPKTGFYNGKPFNGPIELRQYLTEIFIEQLKDQTEKHGVGLVVPPAEWYEMDPEQYAKTHMELGSSVHIAPKFYRSNNWGVK